MSTDAKMTEAKLIRAVLKQKQKDDLPDLKVTLELTDEVNEEDIILILSPKELQALISGYEAGTRNRIRSRHRYYQNKPTAKRHVTDEYPTTFRVHSESNVQALAE